MARGGARPGAGRKKGGQASIPKDIEVEAVAENLTPLEYMLKTMNNPRVSPARRDRMAIAAAPFCHCRAGEKGVGKKGQQALAAKEAAQGKFAPMKAPDSAHQVQ